MFLIKIHDDEFIQKSIYQLLLQKELQVTKNSDEKFFEEILIEKNETSILIKTTNESIKINIPLSLSQITNAIIDLLHKVRIQINNIDYYPFQQKIIFNNQYAMLGDIHNIIFSSLVLSGDEGLEKISLYKKIWPLDKEIQVNRLDTHLTNLKKKIKNEINKDLNFQTVKGKINLIIN